MKRFLAVFAVIALGAIGTARAQTPTPPASNTTPSLDPSPLLQALLKDITLTPQQQHAVDSIRATYMSRLPPTALTAPDSATLETTRGLLTQALEAVRHVLDARQKNVWDHNVANELSERMRVGP
jgi:hypothetical protein